MASDLSDWLNQDTPGWQPAQVTRRSTGELVPFPASSTPVVEVDFDEEFRITGHSLDPESGDVTLTWNSEFGFHYNIEVSTDLQSWETVVGDLPAQGTTTEQTFQSTVLEEPLPYFVRISVFP